MLISGIGVVAIENPISSALCLITNLLCVAGLFALLDAHFLATVQVIVYAGAIMVLVVFVLMLLNTKVEAIDNSKSSRAYFLVASIFGIIFAGLLAGQLKQAFPGGFTLPDNNMGTVANMGEILYTRYVFPFEAASILILAAIVGAVILAKRKYRI